MTKNPAVKLEPGTKEWLDKTTAKLIALIKNSRTGSTFYKNFETDREYLSQEALDSLLKTAVVEEKKDILETLLAAGANPNVTVFYWKTFDFSIFSTTDEQEIYCLGWACRRGLEDIAQTLIDYGADPELKDPEEKTALDYCKDDPEMYARMINYIQSKNMLDKKQDSNYEMFDYEL